MKDTLTSEGVTANEKKASPRCQSITSFCPRVPQMYSRKQRNCLNMGCTPTNTAFINFWSVKTKPRSHFEYGKAEDSRRFCRPVGSILAIARHGTIDWGPKCARYSARPFHTLCHDISWSIQRGTYYPHSLFYKGNSLREIKWYAQDHSVGGEQRLEHGSNWCQSSGSRLQGKA